MYGCESWIIKKAEHRRTDVFELWCWRRLLRVPWTARRSNKSVLKEISLEYRENWCWSWSCNTLATWCEELTDLKRPWCWERLRTGGKGGNRGWDGWMASMDMSLKKLWEIVKNRGAWCTAVHVVTKSRTQLSDWTTKTRCPDYLFPFGIFNGNCELEGMKRSSCFGGSCTCWMSPPTVTSHTKQDWTCLLSAEGELLPNTLPQQARRSLVSLSSER